MLSEKCLLLILLIILPFFSAQVPKCGDPDFRVDEAENIMGPNRCSEDCECDQGRLCSSEGWCHFCSDLQKWNPRKFVNLGCERRPRIQPNVTHVCGDPDFRVDEAQNIKGSNQCSEDCECDQGRLCSSEGWCHFCSDLQKWFPDTFGKRDCERRPRIQPNVTLLCGDPDFRVDEAQNIKGSNQCSEDCECDKGRLCSSEGWCHFCSDLQKWFPDTFGKRDCERRPKPSPVCGDPDFRVDEAKNRLGSNRCIEDCECDQGRLCSPYGYCHFCSDLQKKFPRSFGLRDCERRPTRT